MPVINDSTVVASAYTTSASARPQRLSNGWIVNMVYDTPNTIHRFYVSKDNGLTFIPLCTIEGYNNSGFSLASYNTNVYVILCSSTQTFAWKIDALTQTNVDIVPNRVVIENSQSAFNGCSLTINSTGTELHACWASKNATLSLNFNLRYCKGTINGDGSVTWGAVEQVSAINASGRDNINPSIVSCSNGFPTICCENTRVGYLSIFSYVKYNSINWSTNTVYNGVTYTQSLPSAIFVPQSINGLANGRIWVAWHGSDSGNSNYNIRISYSDDSGVTWSAMQKLTNSTASYIQFPSLTYNKSNEIFLMFQGNVNISASGLGLLKYTTIWSSITQISVSGALPSTLLDSTLNFTSPLFIYRNDSTTKVGFYGSWTVTTISVAQGSIGTKSDRSNLLTYAITTDGVMSTITETINGVSVGTKTLTSGTSTPVGLSQAQWDAIRYGKYKDATGGLNTLTVSMGLDTWTYTFDKRLATTDDIISAIKAVTDSQSTFLSAIKSKLASKVGGLTSDTFENIISNIVLGKKFASGSTTSGASPITAYSAGGSGYANTYYPVTVTGLAFKPSTIIVYNANGTIMSSYNSALVLNGYQVFMQAEMSPMVVNDGNGYSVTTGGFVIGVRNIPSTLCTWVAYE